MIKFILTFITALVLTSCFNLFGSGANSLIKESYNQQSGRKAILFLKEGNATLDNSLQVSVVGYDYELEKNVVGNAFTVDSDHNKAPQDSSSINFVWLTNDSLRIDFDKRLRTFIQNSYVNGVTIIYHAK
jgi:hypothetical protein